jgi:hypothetical protein
MVNAHCHACLESTDQAHFDLTGEIRGQRTQATHTDPIDGAPLCAPCYESATDTLEA